MSIPLTTDQYHALNQLERWYQKNTHQFIDLCGSIYTGTWDIIQLFLDHAGIDKREVMYLSYDQKQVLELASKLYHAYYINGKIYKYIRKVDFDTIPILNQNSKQLEFQWFKEVRKKIDHRYRIMIVLDSVLLSEKTLWDIAFYGLPIILIRDPYLIPASDSYIYSRDPNIMLREPSPYLIRNPIYFMAQSVVEGRNLVPGTYTSANIIKRKDLNLYNIKSSSMNLVMNEETRNTITELYRSRVLKINPAFNVANERVYLASNHYREVIVNEVEKNVKLYMMQGLTGTLTKVNRHAAITRYVGCEFQADCYDKPFTDLYMDRNYLNGVETPSRQLIPEEVVKFEYAYALTPQKARINHWEDVLVILEHGNEYDEELEPLMYYTAITRASRSLTLVI